LDAESYRQAAAVFRSVLKRVEPDQLHHPTLCEPFDVAQLIDKAIGHQDWLRAALRDSRAPSAAPRVPVDYAEVDASEAVSAFDESVTGMLAELRTDGAMTRSVPLSATQTFSGYEMLVLATRNLFQYSWDLAQATGQSTDLAPDLATELLEISRTQLVPLRGAGGFFGPEFVPPPGSPVADVLAGFLGRSF
jgi:uncharacterized protein (TIGR03086 family)